MTQHSHSCISKRHTTLKRDMIRDVGSKIMPYLHIPPFETRDKHKKDALFDPLTCFVTGLPLKRKNTGDHLYEVRSYYRFTGRYGIESDWNRIPVHSSVNATYKIFKLSLANGQRVTRNIGYQALSTDEYSACTPEQKHIYDTISAWKRYVTSREVQLSFTLPASVVEDIDTKVRYALRSIDETTESIVANYIQGAQPCTKLETSTIKKTTKTPSNSDSENELPLFDPSQWDQVRHIRQSGKSKGRTDVTYYHVVTKQKRRSMIQCCLYQQDYEKTRHTCKETPQTDQTPKKTPHSQALQPTIDFRMWMQTVLSNLYSQTFVHGWSFDAVKVFWRICSSRTLNTSSTSF